MDTRRQLLSGRWLTLGVLALVLVAACVLLGRWQYSRSYRPADSYSQEPAAVPLDSVDSAAHPLAASFIDRQVSMSGEYDVARQRLIPGHVIEGAPVFWVVTPLRLADGSAIEVVRGWLTKADAELERPAGSVIHVTGRIQSLQPSPGTSADAPDQSVAIATLLRQLPYPTRSGFVVRTAQMPPDPLSLQPVPSKAPATVPGAKQFYLQNAVYTVQWWIFALLVPLIWLRLFRMDLTTRREHRNVDPSAVASVMTP